MAIYGYGFENFIEALQNLGIVDVILPFILVFTIVFAVLQRTELLGKGKKNFNVIIALVVALSVVIPHVLGTYPSGYDVVEIMNASLPQVALLTIAFLMLMILAGLVGLDIREHSLSGLLVIISIVAILAIFGGAAGLWESGWLYDFFSEETIALVIMVLVFGLIIWFITREESRELKLGETIKDFLNWFKK